MISAVNNSPSFTSVMPVRVYVDGVEKFDEKLIKSSCRKLYSILMTRPQTENHYNIMRTFVQNDKDYKNIRVFNPQKPSDFFKCIIERGYAYLTTGPQTQAIQRYGKAVGKEKIACKERGIDEGLSIDLTVARQNYGNVISDMIHLAKHRLVDKNGRLLSLEIHMKSNGKKPEQSTFKMNVDKILFT